LFNVRPRSSLPCCADPPEPRTLVAATSRRHRRDRRSPGSNDPRPRTYPAFLELAPNSTLGDSADAASYPSGGQAIHRVGKLFCVRAEDLRVL